MRTSCFRLLSIAACVFSANAAFAAATPQEYCVEQMKKLPGEFDEAALKLSCDKAQVIDGCYSVEKKPIFHIDSPVESPSAKKVLVFALVHGDETQSGSIARQWMTRLTRIAPRSHWRIVPILNPDGLKANTRTNANGVDINRNFPTEDWQKMALNYWKGNRQQDPRRYPGQAAASEPETQCAISQIRDFSPNFIVSVHSPYGVLDFDGPSVSFPKFDGLPWVSLGTFPGSLGRYMWVDHKTPVLTIELKDGEILKSLDRVEALQDVTGTVAIRAGSKVSKQQALNQ